MLSFQIVAPLRFALAARIEVFVATDVTFALVGVPDDFSEALMSNAASLAGTIDRLVAPVLAPSVAGSLADCAASVASVAAPVGRGWLASETATVPAMLTG